MYFGHNSSSFSFHSLYIIAFSSNGEEYGICLMGDFNTHTKYKRDYITIDNDIQQILNFQSGDFDYDKYVLEELGYPLQRHSSDNFATNYYSRRLLDMCQFVFT